MDDDLKWYYENEGCEELRIQEDGIQYTEFLTLTKYFDQVLSPGSKILDPCAGTGVYAFYLADKGHYVIAGDLFEVNVNAMRQKQSVRIENNQSCMTDIYQGNALDLTVFPDESFDAVLCMGALYHMKDLSDRNKAVSECLRVLKPGGAFIATYINRYAAVIGNCQGDLADIDEMMNFLQIGVEGVFYTHTPSQLETELSHFPLEKLFHIGADGIGYLLHGENPIITYEGLVRFRELHFATCEIPELLGYSYHGAFIGKKNDSSV